ncbi:MAG TPA: cytosine permease [Candidatus Eisenbergiella pullicola]|nr:cytosine permease [Candidatus Eisenbergiella pullicola]
MKKITGFEIKAEERQRWGSIAMVWIGSVICVPALMIGGMLGSGLSLGNLVLAILLGYALICVFMIFMGMLGCDTGLPTALMASSALGEKGAKYIISAILAISCIGWFGIQAAVCGASFSSMLGDMTGVMIPLWLSSVRWGMIMLLTACFRFSGLKWLNKIAVPLLAIVLAYTLIDTLINGGMSALIDYTPSSPISFVSALSATVGSFVVAAAISGDYCRFAKSRADVVKSSIAGVLPAGLAILLIGAILAICTGTYDISAVLSSSGLPLVGLIALILATWTTNVSNAYSGGLSLSVLLGQDEKKSQMTTAIAGIIGTILAAAGILNSIQGFLSLLSAIVPALIGTMIADYWILGKGSAENFRMREGFYAPGLISFLAGAFIACVTGGTFASIPFLSFLNFPFFIGPVNGIVVAMLVYLILAKAGKKEG